MTLRIEIAAIHVHLHTLDDDAKGVILARLAALTERTEVIMTALSDALAKLSRIENAVDHIRQDIADLKTTLPAPGMSMSPEDVATLSAAFDAVIAKAETLDAENPGT